MKTRAAILWFFCFLNSYFLILPSAPAQEEKPDDATLAGRAEFLKAFNAPEEIILYYINPFFHEPTNGQKFYGHEVIGSTALKKKDFKIAVGAISNSILEWTSVPQNFCGFEPRHGVTITSKGRIYDLLICFTCGVIEIHGNNGYRDQCTVRDSPEVLNRLLADGHVLWIDDRKFPAEEALRALHAPKTIVAYLLDPNGKIAPDSELFHHFKIAGKKVLFWKISNEAKLSATKGIEQWDGIFRGPFFHPTRALRISSDAGTFDFLFSEENNKIIVYKDGQKEAYSGFSLPTGSKEAAQFDKLFAASGFELVNKK